MSTDPAIVTAHSVAEAYLYLKVAPCPHCRHGLLQPTSDLTRRTDDWALPSACQRCRRSVDLRFEIDPPPTRESARSKIINPTDQPSRAIDLLGWLNLFQQLVTVAGRSKDRVEGRELALEAAACLDEALKFYDKDNEMPPTSAFFSDAGRSALRDHPQRFLKSTWRERRMTLPHAGPDAGKSPQVSNKRRWWWPFRRRHEP